MKESLFEIAKSKGTTNKKLLKVGHIWLKVTAGYQGCTKSNIAQMGPFLIKKHFAPLTVAFSDPVWLVRLF